MILGSFLGEWGSKLALEFQWIKPWDFDFFKEVLTQTSHVLCSIQEMSFPNDLSCGKIANSFAFVHSIISGLAGINPSVSWREPSCLLPKMLEKSNREKPHSIGSFCVLKGWYSSWILSWPSNLGLGFLGQSASFSAAWLEDGINLSVKRCFKWLNLKTPTLKVIK